MEDEFSKEGITNGTDQVLYADKHLKNLDKKTDSINVGELNESGEKQSRETSSVMKNKVMGKTASYIDGEIHDSQSNKSAKNIDMVVMGPSNTSSDAKETVGAVKKGIVIHIKLFVCFLRECFQKFCGKLFVERNIIT